MINEGDTCVITQSGQILCLCKCVGCTQTLATLRGHRFNRATGREYGAGKSVVPMLARVVTGAEAAAINDSLAREEEEREQARDAKRRAEYDALPEAVKYADAVRFFAEGHKIEVFAKAPIEHLRGLAEWIKSQENEP